MPPLKYFLLGSVASLLLFCGCSVANKPDPAAAGCDVSWIEGSHLSPQQACALRALAKRCAVSDRCEIECEAKGGLPHTGGGCAHVCQGGGAGRGEARVSRMNLVHP